MKMAKCWWFSPLISVLVVLLAAACGSVTSAPVTTPTTSPPMSADILFVWNRHGYAELWTIDAASGRAYWLCRAPDLSMDFAPSPDGHYIAFVRATDDETEGLWVMDRDGRNLRQLYHHEARYTVYHNPAWTPDGRFIYFDLNVIGDAQPIAIYRIPSEGGEAEMVAEGRLRPIISPDGKRLLSGPELAFSDLDGGDLQPVLPVGKQIGWSLARLSPDGRWIALDGYRGEWTSNVYVVAVDGSELRQLTHLVNVYQDGEVGGLAWTANGRQIVYSIHGPRKVQGIWVIDADGGQPRRLLASKTWLSVEGRLAPTDSGEGNADD
jgi:Tol biopolymer transport system component